MFFLEFFCFFYDPIDVGNLISGSSAFLKCSLYIRKVSVHILQKSSLKHFEHYLARMWNDHDYVVVSTFFGTALLWDWNEYWPFPVLWPLLSFPNLLTYWVQHFHSVTGVSGVLQHAFLLCLVSFTAPISAPGSGLLPSLLCIIPLYVHTLGYYLFY